MHITRPYRINTLFLSDLHLGSSSCHAESINQLLCSIDCKTIYLVGDIVDFWAIKRRGVGLVESHVEVIKTLLIKARQGTKIHYVTGNHDDGLRSLLKAYPFEHGLTNINLCNQCNFISKSGKKYLVLHGDQFDNQLKCSPLINVLGDTIYDSLIYLNRLWNKARTKRGHGYWSLASAVKSKSSRARRYIQEFEQIATQMAKRKGYDGIICGHIHIPADKNLNDTHYLNTGDWQDSCSAIIEHENGELELLDGPNWLRSRANNEVFLARVV